MFIQSERIELVHQVLSERSFDRVGTHHIVDNGTRRLARAETGEVIALCKILVSLFDARIDFFCIDLERKLYLVVLEGLYCCFHSILLFGYFLNRGGAGERT